MPEVSQASSAILCSNGGVKQTRAARASRNERGCESPLRRAMRSSGASMDCPARIGAPRLSLPDGLALNRA
jgi:hypothetical protein